MKKQNDTVHIKYGRNQTLLNDNNINNDNSNNKNFVLTHVILKLHYCALGTFPQKIVLHRVWENNCLIGGQNLAARGVSKFKVDLIFIIFRKFDIKLEIIDS